MKLRKWLHNQSWPVLIALMAGIIAVLFALNAGYWWVAHQLSWWFCALLFTVLSFGTQFVKSFAAEARKHLRWRP